MARRLVIIGGDAAGMSAATQVRRTKTVAEMEVVVFERSSRTSYAACGLPYLVGGFVKSPDSLIARTPEQHRAKGIDVRTRHEVTAIDVRASTVAVRDLNSGRVFAEHYDELLIGSGASGISPQWPGIDAKGVLQLRTLDDAATIEQLIASGARRAVVVGAGYIGLEVAEGLLERGLHVTVVERLDAPMGAVLDADMAMDVAGAMTAAGIDLRLGTAVTGFTVVSGRVTAVETAAGPVEADLVVIGLRVRPNAGWRERQASALGDSGGIRVDDHLRTDTPHIWAAGTASSPPPDDGRAIGGADDAYRQGPRRRTNIAGGDAAFGGVPGR
ncbi:MAG: FAD-dependent oxidoreductase [Betaproteobacteria bacterium]|nr:FAD-dependent oxidoreductase [Betaproteobacteria bacterium]